MTTLLIIIGVSYLLVMGVVVAALLRTAKRTSEDWEQYQARHGLAEIGLPEREDESASSLPGATPQAR